MKRYIYACNRQILLSLIVVAILVVGVVGITFGFFSYVRTGNSNILKTGTIHFNSSETIVNVLNAFPITKEEAQASRGISTNANVTTSTITISGDTSYSGGLDFRITAQAVTKVGKTNGNIPISVLVTKSGNINDVITNDFEDGTLTNNSVLASGHIAGEGTNVSETITIKAYIDKSKVAISDTLENGNIEVDGYTNGTTSAWVNGRTVLTTSEWNDLKNNPASFKIRVEAIQNDGDWAYSLS